MLWLNLSQINKNISEIAYNYLMLKNGGVPRRMRADGGNENETVVGIQRFLRRNKSHQNCSFLLEKSIANQRIEVTATGLKPRTTSASTSEVLPGLSPVAVT